MTHNHKAARRHSDQYHCHHCGKQWDVNDPDPPECTDSHRDEGVLHCAGVDSYTPKQRYKSNDPGGYYCNDCDRWYCNSDPCLHH